MNQVKLTKPTKKTQVERLWYLVDVKDQILGRVSTDIAQKLMGKGKTYYARNIDCGNYVVVINAKNVAVTGDKEKTKLYGRYSGYPGGLKQKALWQVRRERPTQIIRHAVFGMLPKNKLRSRLITRLYIYESSDHPYQDKFERT